MTFTLYIGQNPYAQADIFGFISSAEQIAAGLMDGEYVTVDRSSTYQRWGTFLAPFWLLPGPSLLYASIVNAFVGSLAVYNVYVIARYYHSHYAGVLTVAPLALFPSVVLVHSTPIREAAVLFGITFAARALLVPVQRNRIITIALAGFGLTLATLHRPDNLVIYLVAIGTGGVTYAYYYDLLRRSHLYLVAALSVIGTVLTRDRILDEFAYLAWLRDVRARGRTAYLAEVIPETPVEIVSFSWVGALYFLLSPFPWMIENLQDLLIGVESIIIFIFLLAAPFGARHVAHQSPSAAIGLVVSLLVAAILYGFGTANVGTAVRHRQMFTWVIFLFGAIGISSRVRFHFRIRTNRFVPEADATDTDKT